MLSCYICVSRTIAEASSMDLQAYPVQYVNNL